MFKNSLNLTELALAIVLGCFSQGFFRQKAIANPTTNNTARLQEISRCSQALNNATVFHYQSGTNKTTKIGTTQDAFTQFGEALIGKNCSFTMLLEDGFKSRVFLLNDGRVLILKEDQILPDVVAQKTKVTILAWDVVQVSSEKVFRIALDQNSAMLLRSN